MLKNEIIKLLEENRDKSISGQEIANTFGVTRASVHKAIGQIRSEGFSVEAVTNKGYRLADGNDVLSEEGIRVYLDEQYKKNRLFVFDKIRSTSTYAKQKAIAEECQHGDVVIANEQFAGRGRLGRTFYSPSNGGIYMSFVLKPNMSISDATVFTVTAAVAVCVAIEKVTGIKPMIKWVNDVFIDGKKVCGILSEAVSNFENQMVESVVVGIGVNVKDCDFPDEIKNVATAIGQKGVLRNKLVAEIVNSFMKFSDNLDKEWIINEYKARSLVIDKEIVYIQGEKECKAIVLDINNDGNLVVKNQENQVIVLKSGEISIGSKNI